jgi:hypothetical protein
MKLNKVLLSTLLMTALLDMLTLRHVQMMIISEQTPNYTVPATYTFERSSSTTVDFSGQRSFTCLKKWGIISKLLLQMEQWQVSLF